MDRRVPEWAMPDGKWQRTAVGHPLCWDEVNGCSGWCWRDSGPYLGLRLASYLRWKLGDRRGGIVC